MQDAPQTRPAKVLAVPAAVAAAVLLVRYELWFLVLGLLAFAVVIARDRINEYRLWLPASLLAASMSPSSATTEAAAVEIAVVARCDPAVLERAAAHVHRVEDPRRWSQAMEQLTVAADLVRTGSVPAVSRGRTGSTRSEIAWALVAGGAVGVAMASASTLWLVPAAVAYSVAMVRWTDRSQRLHHRPARVAHAAEFAAEPSTRTEGETVGLLVALSGGHVWPLRRAVAMVDAWPDTEIDRVRCRLRLEAAIDEVRRSGAPQRLAKQSCVVVVLSAAAGLMALRATM